LIALSSVSSSSYVSSSSLLLLLWFISLTTEVFSTVSMGKALGPRHIFTIWTMFPRFWCSFSCEELGQGKK
jgi:hypothetical protein